MTSARKKFNSKSQIHIPHLNHSVQKTVDKHSTCLVGGVADIRHPYLRMCVSSLLVETEYSCRA